MASGTSWIRPNFEKLSRRGFMAGTAALALVSVTRAQEAVTIEHALGSSDIAGQPERVVVGTDFVDLEYTLALGVVPVAYGNSGSWGRGTLPWQLGTGIEDVPQIDVTGFVLSPETVIEYDPDLIISMTYVVTDVAEQLGQIAPLVGLEFGRPWRDGLRLTAKALGRSEIGEERIAETEALIAEFAERLAPLRGKKIMIGSLYGDTLYVIGEGGIAEQFAELGLTFVPTPSADANGLANYSIENVDILQDADILLSFATDKDATARLEAFAPFQRLPAVAGRAYAPLDAVTSSAFSDNFSPLSAKWILPLLADLLEQAGRSEGIDVTHKAAA
jgi:iron complex transport system substrate-binding protein